MTFRVRQDRLPVTGALDNAVWVLEDHEGGHSATVWPSLGFNCLAWRSRGPAGELTLLYTDPNLGGNPRPTRGGIPVLFPFPNRIRDGEFTWEDQRYQLPRNDSSGQNAIHGFACRHPWRVVDQGADEHAAWLTGEYWAAQDAPETLSLWPADHRIRLTYRLSPGMLRLEAAVDNPAGQALPFGLGFHPYFRLPLREKGRAEDVRLTLPVRETWQLRDGLPTGPVEPLGVDYSTPQPATSLTLDDVYTGLPAPEGASLIHGGSLIEGKTRLSLDFSSGFRELVVFTPPHRQAIALEPYTCTTDAINLQARGIDAGWLVLEPGRVWRGQVEMHV
jgi:aldose 1-epimerase